MKITRCLIIVQCAVLVVSQDYRYYNERNEELEHVVKVNLYRKEDTARTLIATHQWATVYRNTRNGNYSFGYMDEETITNNDRVRVKIIETFAVHQIKSHSLHQKRVRIDLKNGTAVLLDFLESQDARQFVGRTFDADYYKLRPELNFVLEKLTRVLVAKPTNRLFEKTVNEQVHSRRSPIFVKLYQIDGDGELLCVFQTVDNGGWESVRLVFPSSLASHGYEKNQKVIGLAVTVRAKGLEIYMLHFQNVDAAESFRAKCAALWFQPITAERVINDMKAFMRPEDDD